MEENQGDYDDDQEEFGDDDYIQNYFEPGEGDDIDDGGGDDEGGGESLGRTRILAAHISASWYLRLTSLLWLLLSTASILQPPCLQPR
jgi:hypothetical protein